MMKCKKMKILVILLLVVFVLSSEVFALTEWIGQADVFVQDGKKEAEDEGKTTNTDILEERF